MLGPLGVMGFLGAALAAAVATLYIMLLSSTQRMFAPFIKLSGCLFIRIAFCVATSIMYASTRVPVLLVNTIFFSLSLQLTLLASIFAGNPVMIYSLPAFIFFSVKLLMYVCLLGLKLLGFNRKPATRISGCPSSSTVG